MRFNKQFFINVFATLLMLPTAAVAGNIDVSTARDIANSFIKRQAAYSPGSFNAAAASDIKLVHAEPSSKVSGSNVYYLFNITGGGFIIIAGDDRASLVLGYNDEGRIDINYLPEPLQDLLDSYKYEIEYLQTHHLDNNALGRRPTLKESSIIIEPMTTSMWGQEAPYDMLTPALNGKQSRVGCAGVCMAQMIYFWKYPLSCDSLESYFSPKLNDTVPGLPGTTFDYSKMLDSYCHWDWDNKRTIQDEYTEEQSYEVAKLCRYVGQATKMNYSPNGSGTTAENKLNTMKTFGYNPNAKTIYLTSYDIETWEELIRQELYAGRPVMYAAYHKAVGHAFILDGLNTENYYHINFGWYGTNNGWYLITAIYLINRYGEYRDYTSKNNMILGMEPPVFCSIKSDDLDANNEMLILGDNLNPHINNVHLYTSHRSLDLLFSLTDEKGRTVATSDALHVIRHTFDQGCDINLPLMLPTGLPSGTYDLNFSYRTSDDAPLTIAETTEGKLTVVGSLAKFNEPFDVADVVTLINLILNSSGQDHSLDVMDVTMLIEHILAQ